MGLNQEFNDNNELGKKDVAKELAKKLAELGNAVAPITIKVLPNITMVLVFFLFFMTKILNLKYWELFNYSLN
jgi:hypothetical protein